MRADYCQACSEQQLVQLPASFAAPSPATMQTQLEPAATPLTRPDPGTAWRDLATVASVLNVATDLLLMR